MIESPDFRDPVHGIPVFSLYGAVRRPTDAMIDACDVFLVDLQDVGCRIYTFITTLLYVLEAAAAKRKAVWVLDRPNPAGRPIEGLRLRPGCESFVGSAPLPMRHGLTMGELARWFVREKKLDVACEVVAMEGWKPSAAPGFGWPLGERSWVNPSPNIPSPWTTHVPGDGPPRRHDALGGTRHDPTARGAGRRTWTCALLHDGIARAQWMRGCRLRPCWFEPTFHKHVGQLCAVQIVDDPGYDRRIPSLALVVLAFRRCRRSGPTIRSGATSSTNTSRDGWRSTC
jgi:uncharacterized protein YbbC (DUF1343 family)